MGEILRYKGLVDERLKSFFDVTKRNFSEAQKPDLLERVAEYTLRGGKRTRALSSIFSYMCFKDYDREILGVAASMELLQSALLIHDDIMDNDEKRRGKPSLHKIYEEQAKTILNFRGNAKHFGNSLAMLAGDIAANLVFEPILYSNFPDRKKIFAIKYTNKMLIREGLGQGLDMLLGAKGLNEVKKEEVIGMYHLKTVPYTTRMPLFLGAMFGDATHSDIEKFIDIADRAGVAFQLRDDILGVFGNEQETGKPDASDLREGKKTFLLLEALEKASADDRKFILSNIGREMNEQEIERIKGIIRTNSLGSSEDYITKLRNEAIGILKPMEIRKEGKQLLEKLINFITQRNN